MLYIKGFDKDLKCCNNYQFEIGKEYKIENDEKPEICSDSVFHFCESLSAVHNFYSCEREKGNRFCYIESLSEIVQEGSKFGCKHIKIVKEIVGDELNILLCLVNNNTGLFNIGFGNSGSGNTDSRNTGNNNTGFGNSGDGNSGSCNSGDGNIGLFNSCNFSTGIFCNKQDNIKIFNIDSGMTIEAFTQSKYYKALCSSTFILTRWDEKQNKTVPIEYKEACKNWWDNMNKKNKAIILSMPNFDKEVFEDITGIEIN